MHVCRHHPTKKKKIKDMLWTLFSAGDSTPPQTSIDCCEHLSKLHCITTMKLTAHGNSSVFCRPALCSHYATVFFCQRENSIVLNNFMLPWKPGAPLPGNLQLLSSQRAMLHNFCSVVQGNTVWSNVVQGIHFLFIYIFIHRILFIVRNENFQKWHDELPQRDSNWATGIGTMLL